jgi:hypothetical protein
MGSLVGAGGAGAAAAVLVGVGLGPLPKIELVDRAGAPEQPVTAAEMASVQSTGMSVERFIVRSRICSLKAQDCRLFMARQLERGERFEGVRKKARASAHQLAHGAIETVYR